METTCIIANQESKTNPFPNHASEEIRELRKLVHFKGFGLDEAIKHAGIMIRHPYIHWPAFGGKPTKPGAAIVRLVALEPRIAPASLGADWAAKNLAPLSAAELVEFNSTAGEELRDLSLFALSEKCSVVGYSGYAYIHKHVMDTRLDLWYFYQEWPKNAFALLRELV